MGDIAKAWRVALTDSALLAAGFKVVKNKAFEMLHPRGGDGRFIDKAGAVRWRDDRGLWRRGTVDDINADGTIVVREPSGQTHVKKARQVFNAPQARATLTATNMKKIGGQGGSNPGFLGQDPKTGDKWYVKYPKSQGHAAIELAGHRLYELVGAPVPDTRLSQDGSQFFSKIEDSVAWGDVTGPDRDEIISDIRRNFVVDAWLANWDAPVTDNIRVTPDGIPLRVDTGGTMIYRAQGAPKNFTPQVTELQTLRDPHISWAGSKLYGNITKDEEEDGVKRILAASPDSIRQTIRDAGAPSHVAETLIARRAFIAEHYGFTLPEATPEGKKILESKDETDAAPDLTPAVKKTPKGEAAPLAPGSPVWLRNKPDDGKRYQDTWLVQNVTADQTTVTIKGLKGNHLLTVPTSDVELLRMNFASVNSKYSGGERPETGDTVRTLKNGNGVIQALYPMYAQVGLDDGTKKVIEVRKLTLLKPTSDTDLDGVVAAGALYNKHYDSSKQRTHLKAAEAMIYAGDYTRDVFATATVIPTQPENQTNTDGGGAGPKNLEPIVAKIHGKYYLLDGHHRVKNTTTFKGWLVDFDARDGWTEREVGTATGERDYFVLSPDNGEGDEIVLMMTTHGCYRQDGTDWLPLDPERDEDNFDDYSITSIYQDLGQRRLAKIAEAATP